MGLPWRPPKAYPISALASDLATPIKLIVKQMETLLQKLLLWDNWYLQGSRVAEPVCLPNGKGIGQLMAIRLAEIVTELMQSVLQRPTLFWHTSFGCKRYTPVGSEPGGARTEAAATGLVKILRLPNDGKAQQRHERKTRISLVLAAGWIPCSCGFRQHGCLL